MKIDFHVHTDLSPCAVIKPKLAVKIARKRGLNAIAIVNHNKLLKFKDDNFCVIHGEEIKSKQGEIIGLFLKDEIKGGLDAQKTIDLIKKQGGFAVLPHPFDKFRRGVKGHVFELRNFDFIELNGRCLFKSFNNKVAEFSKDYGIPTIGGSDAHYYPEIGHVITEVEADNVKDAMHKILNKKSVILNNKLGLIKYKCYVNSMLKSGFRKSLKRIL